MPFPGRLRPRLPPLCPVQLGRTKAFGLGLNQGLNAIPIALQQ
jgi:hypothetical protein